MGPCGQVHQRSMSRRRPKDRDQSVECGVWLPHWHATRALELPVRWYIVNRSARQLSPADEAFRYFVPSHGRAHMAAMFKREAA